MVVLFWLKIFLIMSFKQHIALLNDSLPKEEDLEILNIVSEELAKEIVNAALEKKLTLIFGNGGSATDASHWSSELVASYEQRGRKALPVISLTENLSTITAIANDDNFENVFARQVDAYGSNLGLAIGLSTSGQSKNVLRALDNAKKYGSITVLITGSRYEKIGKYDKEIIFNSNHVGTIQTLSQIFYHSVSDEVEKIIS